MTEEEVRRATELDRYFAIIPAFQTAYREIKFDYVNKTEAQVRRPYNSALETPLTCQELRSYLRAGGFFAERDAVKKMAAVR